LLDNQQFSDPEEAALRLGISSALWPLFGQVWPMSKILAEVMELEILEERRILEVGCGIALPSIVVKQRGGDISASDYHPLARTFLEKNLVLNSLGAIPFSAGNWDIDDTNVGKYDLIIASDLLYEAHHAEQLSLFIHRRSHSQTKVIVVDPNRGFHRIFARAMARHGFSHTWSDLSDYTKEGQNKPTRGFLFRFSRT
jgi:predicted nicotinamide N-methyase